MLLSVGNVVSCVDNLESLSIFKLITKKIKKKKINSKIRFDFSGEDLLEFSDLYSIPISKMAFFLLLNIFYFYYLN